MPYAIRFAVILFRLAPAALGLLALLLTPAFGQEKTVSDADNGHEIAVQAGDTLVVRLPSHGDGGYQWNLVQNPADTLLTLTGQGNLPPPQPLPGAFGTDEFRFRAGTTPRGAAQSVWLRFLCLRPFEKGIGDAILWQVHVTVAGTGAAGTGAAALAPASPDAAGAPDTGLGRALAAQAAAWTQGDAAGYYAVTTADYHEADADSHRRRRADAVRALTAFFARQRPVQADRRAQSVRLVTPTEARVVCLCTREYITRNSPPTPIPTGGGTILQNNAAHAWLTSRERQGWVFQGEKWRLRWSRTETIKGMATL